MPLAGRKSRAGAMQEVVEAASNDGVFGYGPRRRNFEGGANAAFSLGRAERIAGIERLRPGKSCASEPTRNCVGVTLVAARRAAIVLRFISACLPAPGWGGSGPVLFAPNLTLPSSASFA